MTDAVQEVVILGAGLAGVGAAETLRREGFTGHVTLISSDPAYPYDHVPLSKNYLRDEPGHHQLFVHDVAFYGQQRIDLRLATRASAIDPLAREVRLASDERIPYDKLLIATGSRNRRLHIPGNNLDGIFYLRTLDEADRLKAVISQCRRLVVVGAGFVGCEVAASAQQLGLDVTLVGSERLPMLHALGPIGGVFYRDIHLAHGVRLHMEARAAVFRGRGGHVHAVVLTDGTELATDIVMVGIGAQPDIEMAAAAGIPVDSGIITDAMLATGVPDVYAAGDVASVPYPFLDDRLRVEHFATALSQGPVAARNMLGENVRYDGVPFFFSDQYDVWMEYTGHSVRGAETVIRGDAREGTFVVFWLREDRLVAAMNVNARGVPDVVTPIITAARPVDRLALADPHVDLASLAG